MGILPAVKPVIGELLAKARFRASEDPVLEVLSLFMRRVRSNVGAVANKIWIEGGTGH
jgi:hypothetical protein